MQETRVQSLSGEDPLEEEMATHSSILDWKIPWAGEPGRLQTMWSQRLGHTSVHTWMHTCTSVHIHGHTSAYMVDLHCCVSFRYTAQ